MSEMSFDAGRKMAEIESIKQLTDSLNKLKPGATSVEVAMALVNGKFIEAVYQQNRGKKLVIKNHDVQVGVVTLSEDAGVEKTYGGAGEATRLTKPDSAKAMTDMATLISNALKNEKGNPLLTVEVANI